MNTAVPLAQMTATQLLPLFRKKAVSPVEVLSAVFERIDVLEDRCHPFCYQAREAAIAAAVDSEARWLKVQ